MIGVTGEVDRAIDPRTRLELPEEVTGLVVFLPSEESSHRTGAEYAVDGGMTAGSTAG